MFAQNPDVTTLRQGDIIADVLFPLARMDKPVVFLGTYSETSGQLEPVTEQTRKSRYQLAQLHATVTLCAVFSQDCDVDPKQERPPPAFVLCRVAQVPQSIINSPGYANLRENANPYGESRPYFQFFYFGALPGREGLFFADYGQVMTVSWTDYRHVLKKKILELEDVERSKFRVKAGAHVGRPSNEEIAAGIADPWRQHEETPPKAVPLGRRLSRAWRVIKGQE